MGRKKFKNESGIPQHVIERIARCMLPDIQAYYESEEGKREFAEWQRIQEAQRETEKKPKEMNDQ